MMFLQKKTVDFPWQSVGLLESIPQICVCVLIMVNLCPVVWSTSLTNRVLNARFRLVPRASFRGDPIFDHVCFGLL